MKKNERRKEIIGILANEKKAVAGDRLSELLFVSRQIIVQDISALREEGYDIASTHQGYLLRAGKDNMPVRSERVFEVRHTSEQTEDELSTIVNNGGTVVDVFIKHGIYGKIAAKLNIFSERAIAQFVGSINSGKSTELMHITEGHHYHTVAADTKEILDKIEEALEEKGYLVKA